MTSQLPLAAAATVPAMAALYAAPAAVAGAAPLLLLATKAARLEASLESAAIMVAGPFCSFCRITYFISLSQNAKQSVGGSGFQRDAALHGEGVAECSVVGSVSIAVGARSTGHPHHAKLGNRSQNCST